MSFGMLANTEQQIMVGKLEQTVKVQGVFIPEAMKRHLLQTLAQLIRLFPNEAQKMVRDVVK